MLKNFNIKVSNKIEIIEPLGYLDFLKLENNAKIIITDSGGLQEESCIMGVPCVTIRDNTERPETVDAGSNILAGADKVKIERAVKCFIKNKKKWNNPFGKIGSAKRIISHILK
jgi:UDP-N-acetylglucosamine 2-epimerase (non-hydrolysing)